ncbi:hypothetical protein PAXRUDRAFT_170659, partial [Paxillus rubicundulus Ve08.2h10]
QLCTAHFSLLMNYLHDHHVEQGNTGNPKLLTCTSAALAIAPLCKIGPVKTGPMCKMEWTVVCSSLQTFSDTHMY